MLKYSEHSPVLGYRGYWTAAADGCCRSPAALTPPFSANARQPHQQTIQVCSPGDVDVRETESNKRTRLISWVRCMPKQVSFTITAGLAE